MTCFGSTISPYATWEAGRLRREIDQPLINIEAANHGIYVSCTDPKCRPEGRERSDGRCRYIPSTRSAFAALVLCRSCNVFFFFFSDRWPRIRTLRRSLDVSGIQQLDMIPLQVALQGKWFGGGTLAMPAALTAVQRSVHSPRIEAGPRDSTMDDCSSSRPVPFSAWSPVDKLNSDPSIFKHSETVDAWPRRSHEACCEKHTVRCGGVPLLMN